MCLSAVSCRCLSAMFYGLMFRELLVSVQAMVVVSCEFLGAYRLFSSAVIFLELSLHDFVLMGFFCLAKRVALEH